MKVQLQHSHSMNYMFNSVLGLVSSMLNAIKMVHLSANINEIVFINPQQ
jgi:hypothetical protein